MPKLGTMDKRITYRRRKTWNTRSNKIKKVRTPGNIIVVHHTKKKVGHVKTPAYEGHKALSGIKRLRSSERHRAKKNTKTVTRAYGGVLTHDIVRDRIIRAFLIEEQKIVKQVLKMKKKSAKKPTKQQK